MEVNEFIVVDVVFLFGFFVGVFVEVGLVVVGMLVVGLVGVGLGVGVLVGGLVGMFLVGKGVLIVE